MIGTLTEDSDEQALDGLPAQDDPLRARLLPRLSLELTFTDETQRTESLSLEAVAMARRLGDPMALRSAIDARWMAVWGPDGLEERTALAAELLHVAAQTGDREMELDGLAMRAASSLESGDIPAVGVMVVTIGVVGGALAVPLGLALHRWILPVTGNAAGTGIPDSVLAVYGPLQLVGLGAAGVALAVLGALVPAGWAGQARAATALRAE